MFGYVTIHKPELRVREFYEFRAFYCGLCQVLKEKYGMKGQMTLTYDMTFLVMLLTSLYEPETKEESRRCLVHPTKAHAMLKNEVTEYAATMNIALTWHHLEDDWQDERKALELAGMQLYRRSYRKVEQEYPRQCAVIKEKLAELSELERAGEELADLDALSSCFGELMAELFVMRKDHWEETLRKLGFYLGKFIYLMDAYDDLPEDMKKGRFNPLKCRQNRPGFEEECRQMLVMMMAECTEAFERLPLIKDIDILRNILYNGVWSKYEKLRTERNGDHDK